MASNERFRLPPELEDDQQAAVLYSPFRDKSVNPQSWSRKMKFWENLLIENALQHNTVTFDINRLPQYYERKGMTPKCLTVVIEALKKSGRIKTASDYKRSNSWLSWGFDALVKQPLSWGVNQLFGSPKKDTDIFVWPEVVKKLADAVVDLHISRVEHELTDNLVSYAQLRTHCRSLIPSDQDFDVVLTQLERDKKVAITETQDKDIVIKFCKREETAVSPIKEIELQIYKIQSTQRKLEDEIEVMSSRAQLYHDDARLHIREGRKTMAKHSLRKHKNILKTIDRKMGSLNTLHDIIQKIEDASTNEMVVRACETGVLAMKNLSSSLTLEKAESVMDDVQEALENQEDINQALSSSVMSDEDNDQLEKDLEALLSEGETSKDPRTSANDRGMLGEHTDREEDELLNAFNSLAVDDMGFPNVPTHSPSASSHSERRKPDSQRQPLSSS